MSKETLAEMVSRKHFQMVADTLKAIKDPAIRAKMAANHASAFAKQNPRFDHARFMKASNVPYEHIDVKEETSVTESVGELQWNIGEKDKQNALLTKHHGEQIAITTGPTAVHPYTAHIGKMVVHYPFKDLEAVKRHVEGMCKESVDADDLEMIAEAEEICADLQEDSLTKGFGVTYPGGYETHNELVKAVMAAMKHHKDTGDRPTITRLGSKKKIDWDVKFKGDRKKQEEFECVDAVYPLDETAAYTAIHLDKAAAVKRPKNDLDADRDALVAKFTSPRHGYGIAKSAAGYTLKHYKGKKVSAAWEYDSKGKRMNHNFMEETTEEDMSKLTEEKRIALKALIREKFAAKKETPVAPVVKVKESYEPKAAVPGSFSAPQSEFDTNPGYVAGAYQVDGKTIKLVRMGDTYAPIKVVVDHDEWKDFNGEGMRFVGMQAALAAYRDMQAGYGGHQERAATPVEVGDEKAHERMGTNEEVEPYDGQIVNGKVYHRDVENWEEETLSEAKKASDIPGADLTRDILRKNGHSSIWTNKNKSGHSIKVYAQSVAHDKKVHAALTAGLSKAGVQHSIRYNTSYNPGYGTHTRALIVHLPHRPSK